MAITGRGDFPLRSSWLMRRPRSGGFLLRKTPFASNDRNAIFRDWFFASTAGSVSLTATGIESGVPSVGTPTFGQLHVLTGVGIATTAPSVGTPTLGQLHVLNATGIATGAPTVDTPTFNRRINFGVIVHNFTGHVLGSPTLTELAGAPVDSSIVLAGSEARTALRASRVQLGSVISLGQISLRSSVGQRPISRTAVSIEGASIRTTPTKGRIR